MQALLHKLLKAELVLEERAGRNTDKDRKIAYGQGKLQSGEVRMPSAEAHTYSSFTPARIRSQGSQLGTRDITCFQCRKTGHIAKVCPEKKIIEASRRITSIDREEEESWIHNVTVAEEESKCHMRRKGPTYKVDISVEGVQTRGLLDHGVQVSLIRKELLPRINEKQGWSLEQCHSRNLEMGCQPVGAGGDILGATMLVNLQVTVEATGNTEYIPCYVLSSSKPLWKGEVKDCGLILGTNALVILGFMVYHANRATIQPERIENHESNNSEVLRITLG